MSVLNGIASARKEIPMGSVVFSGRLRSVLLTTVTRSIPATKYYCLRFEREIKSLKGTVPTYNEFEFQQICRSEKCIREDDTKVPMSKFKQPISGQFYVVVYDPEEYTIGTLIEINEKDLSLLRKEFRLP